jgi:hypothetical protein
MSEETKNKIFWWVFAFAIIASIVFTYIRVFVHMDYMLVKEVSCDPETELCFVYTAEELCEESEEENCLETTESEYYKIIYKKAANVPECSPYGEEECPELSCAENEPEEECYYEFNE